MQNQEILVCESCLDKFQIQKKSFIVPGDPIPITDIRMESYVTEISTLPPATVPGPFSTIAAPSNSSALTILTDPDPANTTDNIDYITTPPSSYFTILHD